MKKDYEEKLINAWSLGCNDKEAAIFAGMSYETLQNKLKSDQDLKRQRDLIRETPAMKARMNIVKKINSGDVKTSQWYLERKTDEFSTKINTDNTTNATITIEDKEAFFKKMSDKITNGDK